MRHAVVLVLRALLLELVHLREDAEEQVAGSGGLEGVRDGFDEARGAVGGGAGGGGAVSSSSF